MKRQTVLLMLIFGLAPAAAELDRQHGAHVHGEATGTLALDGTQLQLALEVPGVNLVGFEHPPRTDEQAERLAATLLQLEQGAWLQADGRAHCRMADIKAQAHGFEVSDGHAKHVHARDRDDDHHHPDHGDGHGHRHAHGHEHEHRHGHNHAEFHIAATLSCAHPDRLGWVAIALFDDFPGNERITVDVLTETLATRTRLVPGRERIDLQGR